MKTEHSTRRFRDDGRNHFSYLDDIVVTCPKCAATGRIVPFGVAPAHPNISVFAPRRFHCSDCNHRAESRGGIVTFGTDGRYLRLPLRLQARTRHGRHALCLQRRASRLDRGLRRGALA